MANVSDAKRDGSDAADMVDGVVTLWANLVTLIGQHLVDEGMARSDMLELVRMLHDTNKVTIRSPEVRSVAAQRLMAAYTALEEV